MDKKAQHLLPTMMKQNDWLARKTVCCRTDRESFISIVLGDYEHEDAAKAFRLYRLAYFTKNS
jgi:hypothetical protein